MAITIDQVARALREQDLKFAKVSEREILFLLGVGALKLKMVVQLMEDGEYLDVSAMDLGKCPKDHPRLEAVLGKLAHVNYQYKAVKLAWDPSDGEIRARIAVPLEDSRELPTSQLRTIVEFIAVITRRVWPEIEEVLGKPPSEGRRPAQEKKPERRVTAPPSRTPPKPPTASPKKSSPATIILAIGILLLGVAAITAVAYYVFTH